MCGLKLRNLIVFEKLTRACFFQIALETILLPILNVQYYPYWKLHLIVS